MTDTDGLNTPQQSGRLTEVNNNNDNTTVQNQGTETEQFDKIERAAQEVALLTAATGKDLLKQQDDAVRQQHSSFGNSAGPVGGSDGTTASASVFDNSAGPAGSFDCTTTAAASGFGGTAAASSTVDGTGSGGATTHRTASSADNSYSKYIVITPAITTTCSRKCQHFYST